MESKPPHPLHQIAGTPTHKLLLKQWLKEEELILNRIALKETQIDSIRKEITQLYCFFFLFHSTALVLSSVPLQGVHKAKFVTDLVFPITVRWFSKRFWVLGAKIK
ncbi:hypothetical protein LOK49_LG15G01747 [Camellia lanceoleosa]|uniref:Uncharacterized protein n=1 Tax=Camellia lanceoleosa TaxID=1840588 RepID=A0ACC0F768_9ERIC|nr:hypothetical protein LOK49_LG15G01747 [Camellia lanceoleosa]